MIPLLHGEDPSNMAVAAHGDMIERTEYLVFKWLHEGIDVDCEE